MLKTLHGTKTPAVFSRASGRTRQQARQTGRCRGEPVLRTAAMPSGDLNQPGRHQDGDQHQPRHHGRPQVHPGQALVPAVLRRPRTISPRPAGSRNRPKPAMIASGTAPAPGWPPSQLATRITPQPKSPMPLLRRGYPAGAASATDDPDATSHIGRYRFVLSRYGQGAALRTTPPARRGGPAL